jgi:hypothetical protein
MMAQVVAIMAGLILVAESQASDLADRSTHQGFLSKSDYDKFITPNLNRMKHGNELGASPFTVVDDKPILESSAQVQNSSDPISLSIFGIGLVSFVTMLGLTLWRALQPATIPTNTVSALGGQVMEMKAQDSNVKENSNRVGWGQLSSQNSRPLTSCNAGFLGKQTASWSITTDMPEGISGPAGFFDPFGLSKPFADPRGAEGRAKFFREAELKHGRVAMLAALGFPVAEKFHPLFGGNIDAPSYLAFQQTPLETFWPFVVLAIGAMEIQSVSIFEEPFGPNGVGGDKWWTLKADRVPGDFALDPLGLYPSDPEEQIEMKTKELNHCRLAMIGIAGMVVQELVSGGKLF